MPASDPVDSVTTEEIKHEQHQHTAPREDVKDAHGIYIVKKRIWIPASVTKLKLRIAVDADCGERGHRAFAATIYIISQNYWWTEMKQNIREFTQSCTHCIVSRNGEQVPCPLGSALHGERPNDVVNFDVPYMGPSEEGSSKSVLVKKDDISLYT